jgi:hypothetical protein
VLEPASPAARAPASSPTEDGGNGWLIIAGGLALLALVSVAAARVRRRAAPVT